MNDGYEVLPNIEADSLNIKSVAIDVKMQIRLLHAVADQTTGLCNPLKKVS
jgi:hypothetical protein